MPAGPGTSTAGLRWALADQGRPTETLFDPEQLVDRHVGRGEFAGTEFLHVRAKRIINTLGPSILPFRHTINVYRGCSHACTYCFARPTHEYLGLNSGEDFERKIVVKINAVELLRSELAARRWSGEPIAMGTNTDPYQRCEGKYHLTRGVVRALVDAANPFSILTKSTLVLRDLPLIHEAVGRCDVHVSFSIGTLDERVWRETEPGTPPPRQRVAALRRFAEAGVPTGVLVAPVIPGMSDAPEQLRAVIEAVVEAGAQTVNVLPLHLRPGVREHFMGWLERTHPELVASYETRYRRPNLPKADRDRFAAEAGAILRQTGFRRPERGAPTATSRRFEGVTVPPSLPRPAEAPERAPVVEQLQLGMV
jgi:DNA repair photolyase